MGGQITWYLAERAKMGLMQCEEGRLPAAPSAPDFGCQSQVSLRCKSSQETRTAERLWRPSLTKRRYHRRIKKGYRH